MYSPDLEPRPVMMFSTPLGSKWLIFWANDNRLSEVLEDGWITMVQPAASAGAIFHAAIRKGKFHGII